MERKLLTWFNLSIIISLLAVIILTSACKSATTTTPAPSQTSVAASPTATRQSPFFTRTSSQTPTPTDTSATPSVSPMPTPAPIPSAVITESPSISPSSSPAPPASTTSPSSPLATVPPLISITSPYYMSTLPAGNVTVNIVVTNFYLADKVGQNNLSGEGHVIYYLDAPAPTTAGQPAGTDLGTYTETAATSYTWQKVGPGIHVLTVQLVNNDSTPLSPAVTATENIVIK